MTSTNDASPEYQLIEDDISWENPAKKRYPRVSSFIICFLTASGIISYAFIEKTIMDYQALNDTSPINLSKIKTGTITCYTRKPKTTYPVLFHLGFGLLGIIFGTVVDRFSLFVEELFQKQSRYDGEVRKVFKACFSGIGWPVVGLVFGLIIFSCYFGRNTSFEVADIIYIVGGIGVGPLVIHLLNLNVQSEVDVSRILEEREMYPGYTLAWSYYFNHLKPAVEELSRPLTLPEDQPTSSTQNVIRLSLNRLLFQPSSSTQNVIRLSLNKLLLLLPPSTDLADIDKLIGCDTTIHILKKGDKSNPYPFPVYYFKAGRENENQYYAMKCVKEPIIALREIARLDGVNIVTAKTYKNEVKRFYQTLREILKNTSLDGYTNRGLVIPIKVKPGEYESLSDGRLAQLIRAKVDRLPTLNAPAPAPESESEDDHEGRRSLSAHPDINLL